MRLIDADALINEMVKVPGNRWNTKTLGEALDRIPTMNTEIRNATEARILRAYQKAYDDALTKKWIIDPMAYALYSVWSVYDMEGRKRRREAD